MHARTAARAAFLGIALVQPAQIIGQSLVGAFDVLAQRGPGESAVLVVDSLDPGAGYGQQFPAKQIELPAQQHELTEYRPEGRMVVAAEVGDRLEIRLQMPQQPDHLDVAMGLSLKTTA